MTIAAQPTTTTTESIEDQRRRFRDVVGRFATGVTVVTWNKDGEARGMTANAVSSLSLDPMLILVCVARSTTAHEHIAGATTFAVNILAEDQQDVSKAFSQRGLTGSSD